MDLTFIEWGQGCDICHDPEIQSIKIEDKSSTFSMYNGYRQYLCLVCITEAFKFRLKQL